MCKIFGLTETNKIKDHKKLTNTILDVISKQERDGLGFEFVNADGQRFGQRGTGDTLTFTINKPKMPSVSFTNVNKESWGTFTGKTKGPAIFHSRTSTNNVSLKNTHPLRSQGISLIHNGVVTDHGPKYKMTTSNDTEHILNYLRQENGLSKIEKNLTGYYACMALMQDNSLMIFRDRIAPLYAAWCELNETWIFATSERNIEEVWNKMGWGKYLTESYEVKEDYCVIWQGNTLLAEQDIKSRGYGYKESKYASLSLGKELDYQWDDSWNNGYNAQDKETEELFKEETVLTYKELCFTEIIRETLELGSSTYMVIDNNGNEIFDVSECTDEQLLEFSLLDKEGKVTDITNFKSFIDA